MLIYIFLFASTLPDGEVRKHKELRDKRQMPPGLFLCKNYFVSVTA